MGPSHRYVFAHLALPQVVHSDPEKARAMFSGPEAAPFLEFLWKRAGERLPEEARRPPRGLSCETHAGSSGVVIVVVTMPPPEQSPEAFFAAMVFKPGPRKMLIFRQPPTAEYLTLELGHTIEGEARTVLCGWSKDHTHYNMGDGPAPEAAAFLAKVRAMAGDAPS
jgi:hypothetical protein